MIIVFRGQMFHVTSFWKWPDRQSFFFFAYSHIFNPRDSTKPVPSTFKRYSFIAILFSCTGRIRSYFKYPSSMDRSMDCHETFRFPKRKKGGGKKKKKKFIAQENHSFSFARKWKRETKSWNEGTGDRKPSPFGTILEAIVVAFAFARRKRSTSFSFRPRGRNV